ncbi:MAG: DNA polymerase III subunit gamma/tau [Pseudomonadota bacterium]
MTDTPTDDAPAPVPAKNDAAGYQVLARKYRPQSFRDLISHEAMVRTLRNAFSSGRIAHAYVLTGVRGVGKTTTARILARALNYVAADGTDTGPQIDMTEDGLHCAAIAESRHPDVLEMDAASRTGVNDVRELIEGVRYAPVEARYKVYIIDEVHMLSTQAFNALLKTLEEPPPHVKFIFATTEIRKLPVTVLSRCQRFDLRRIEPATLAAHLRAIADKENARIDDEGIAMIARAAEGSVRDGLSILDQAIVQHGGEDGGAVSADTIRDMLGLADRSRVWDLLDAIFKGDAKTALEGFRAQYDSGAEPAVILRDLLELTHLLTRVKAAGPEAAAHGPAGEADAARARNAADGLQINSLTRAWSLLMKGLTETQQAPDPAAACEMALIRVAFASNLPTPDEALRALKSAPRGDGATAASAPSGAVGGSAREPTASAAPPVRVGGAATAPAIDARARSAPDVAPDASSRMRLQTFEDVARLAGAHRDVKLRTELESYVHIISFEPGRIEMRLHDRAPADLPGRLTKALKNWTGDQWLVTVTAETDGADTIRDARSAEVRAHPLVQKTFALFPDAKIASIKDAAPADFAGAPPDPDSAEDHALTPQPLEDDI